MRMLALAVLLALLVSTVEAVPSNGGAAQAQVQTSVQRRSLCDTDGTVQFSDVSRGDYAAAYILCAKALELAEGGGDGAFNAARLTQAQMASFLVRLWRDVLDESCPGAPAHPFTDIAGTTHEAHIACLYALGVTKGSTATTYTPSSHLTNRVCRVSIQWERAAFGDTDRGQGSHARLVGVTGYVSEETVGGRLEFEGSTAESIQDTEPPKSDAKLRGAWYRGDHSQARCRRYVDGTVVCVHGHGNYKSGSGHPLQACGNEQGNGRQPG